MKIQILAVIATLAFAGSAYAGREGAGPAGTGSTIVGNIVASQSQSKAEHDSPLPGKVGIVQLTAEQAASIAAFLRTQSGVVVAEPLISAPTVFADGTDGVISLNTETKELKLTRV